MYKTEKANTYKEHLALEKKGYDHNPYKKLTDPPMTPKEERKHRRKVHKYNKNVAKPLNETQKAKIEDKLSNMDPKDPEAKLLRKMLNLKKNR